MKLDKKDLERAISEIDLKNMYFPETLDRIISSDGEELYLNRDKDYQDWVENAENWDEAPRKTAFIEDYNTLDDELEELLNQEAEKDMMYPGIEGIKFAEMVLEVGKGAIEGDSFGGTIIGFEVPEIREKDNTRQLIAPQGMDSLLEVPEWDENDDLYSDLEEGDYVAVITDHPAAFAKYIQDNFQKKGSFIRSFDDRFWRAYEETLENYEEREKKVKNSF